MENASAKTSVIRRAFSSLSVFFRTLPQNDVENEIKDIDELRGEYGDIIDEIKKVEKQIRNSSSSSKKGIQKQFAGRGEISRPTIMKTVVKNEREEKIRS